MPKKKRKVASGEQKLISEEDLNGEQKLISEEDLNGEQKLISEEDLNGSSRGEQKLISEEDLNGEQKLISEEDLNGEQKLISEEDLNGSTSGESLFKGPRDYNPISSTICHLTNESDGHTTSLYGIGFGPFIITNKHLFRRNNGTLLVQSLHGVFKVKDTATLQQHLIDGRDMMIIRMPKDFPPFPQKLKFREPQREERICLVTTNFQAKSMSSMVSDTSCTFPSSDGIFWKHWIQTKDGQCGSPLVSTRDGFIVGIHSASNFTNTNNYFTSVPKNFMELLTNQEAQQWVSGWRLNADSVLWGGHKVFMVKPEEPGSPKKKRKVEDPKKKRKVD